MKKAGVSLIFAVLFLSFIFPVLAQTADNPTAGLESATGGALTQEGINTGKINQTAQTYKSKAELRIEAINLWLETNASWFKTFLGAVPAISWYFAFLLYFFLWGFVTLVLNAKRNLYLRWGSGKLGGMNTGTILGIVAFILLFIAIKIQVLFANFAFIAWVWANDKWYGQLIRVVSLVLASLLLFGVLNIWGKHREEKAKKDAGEDEETNQEALKRMVEGATGQKS